MKRWVLLLSLLPVLAWGQEPKATDSAFSAAQRAEIVAIIRAALKSDPSILRDAVLALQQDQHDKSQVASSEAIRANHAAIFDDPADPVIGNPHGTVTLVEFFDVRCPYCRRMQPDVEALLKQHPEVRLVLKDLPVLGPPSVLGAKALLAAQAQGGYATMQHALMGNGVTVDPATIQHAAEQAGIDWNRLHQAMDTKAIQARIDANTRLALLLGIQGTPAVIAGDQLVPGAMSLQELDEAVSGKISAAAASSPHSGPN